MIVIGIDPGVTTGYAEWCLEARRLIRVESMKLHEAWNMVALRHSHGVLHRVDYEDARLRTWLGNKGREALQGAGSIKRDCTAWADFLADLGCAYRQVRPQAGATKWDAAKFAKLTGWTARTNEHGRDAALLVWGAK